MRHDPEGRTTIEIRHGAGGVGPRRYRVFIDGAWAGDLNRREPLIAHVPPGTHHVAVKLPVARSETRELTLAAGERRALRCDSHARKRRSLGLWAVHAAFGAFLLVPFLIHQVVGPSRHFATTLFVAWAIVQFLGLYWLARAPGAAISLRPADEPEGPEPLLGVPPLPRLTTFGCMIGLAVIAIVCAIGADEWHRTVRESLQYRRTRYLSQSDYFTNQALIYADLAAASRQRLDERAQEERLAQRQVRARLGDLAWDRSRSGAWSWPAAPRSGAELARRARSSPYADAELHAARDALERARSERARIGAQAAREARMIATCLRLAETYRRAAERPGEPVPDEPAPPAVSRSPTISKPPLDRAPLW